MIQSVQRLARDKPFVIGGDFNLYYDKLIEHLDKSTNFDSLHLCYSAADIFLDPNEEIQLMSSNDYSSRRNDYFVYEGLKQSDSWFGNYGNVIRNWGSMENIREIISQIGNFTLSFDEMLKEINDNRNKKIILDHQPVCCLFVEPSRVTSLQLPETFTNGHNYRHLTLQQAPRWPSRIIGIDGHHAVIREDYYVRREQQSPPGERNSSGPESRPNIDEITEGTSEISLNSNNTE